MIKKMTCFSDIGSVLIGNPDWTFAVPNIGGDGETQVRVYESGAEFATDPWAEGMDFISSAQGTFGIFRYDCDFHGLHSGKLSMKNAGCVLSGRYGCYRGKWKVAFVKWD